MEENLWETTDNIIIDKHNRITFDLSQKNEDDLVEQIFQYYRKNGYPAYQKNEYNLKKEFDKVKNIADEKLINDKKQLNQVMSGCGVLWTYFPHWIDISCGNNISLNTAWQDDSQLRSLIRQTIRWEQKYGHSVFTVNRFRQNAKIYLSKQSVSNFRPTVAKYIYNTYGNKGIVWDMSSGFGGRLMGFYASDCSTYYGTDPSTKTFEGLLKLNEDLKNIVSNKNVVLLKQGSEIAPPCINQCDLCFTSPPYFNTEKYSDESTQSYQKYPTEDLWLNGFLRDTLKNCYVALKNNGKLIININDVVSAKNLTSGTIKIANEEGFKLIDTLQLILSSCTGKGVKTEPVFIFEKGI